MFNNMLYSEAMKKHPLAVGHEKYSIVQSSRRGNSIISQENTLHLPIDPAIPLLGILPKIH